MTDLAKRIQDNIAYRDLALQAFRNTDNFINVLDVDGEILFTNRLFPCIGTRYNIGDNAFKHMGQDLSEQLKDAVTRIVVSKKPEDLFTSHSSETNTTEWFKHSINPNVIDGEVSQFWIFSYPVSKVGMHLSVSEKSSESELREFIGILAHDLKNPLNNIQQLSEILLRNLDNHNLQREVINQLLEVSSKMENIIQSTMDYHNLGSSVKAEPIDLNKELKTIFNSTHPLIGRDRIEIKYGLPENIIGFKAEMLSLLENFLTNAVKYSKPDIKLIFETGYFEKDNFTVIWFKDNGLGISKSKLSQVFMPFKRLHGNAIPGNGLGLSSCKRVAKLHGGHIWVESDEGIGSTFFVSISKNIWNY